MSKFNCLSLCILALLLHGCVTTGANQAPAATALPERFTLPEVAGEQTRPTEGGIYSDRTALDLYADNRAKGVGDVVTVKIVETSSGAKKASTQTTRGSSISGGISSLFGFEKWLSNRNANYTPSATNLSATLTNDFNGSGETKRDSTVTATISARIIDRTMEGNLVLRGYREIRVNNESQFIILSGIVRPEDISKDNTVLSSNIADARIEYGGTGVLADKQQPGWLSRGIDVIWPF